MSAGVDLSPAVGGDVAQDLGHLFKHGQTVDVDLEGNQTFVRAGGYFSVPCKRCATLAALKRSAQSGHDSSDF